MRGRTFKSEIGFVLKVGRENIQSHFNLSAKSLNRDLDLEGFSLKELMYMTESVDEYKKVLSILKKQAFKVSYAVTDKKKKTDKGYDSEDPEDYKDIPLFNS